MSVRGAVQGVGFRPFVYRLATSLGLNGWVVNSPQGVFLDVEGDHERLNDFILRFQRETPPRSFIQSLESSLLDPVGYASFEIRESESAGDKTALVLPDCATCPECLAEIFDPSNRRYLYPFTNCTNCGPRYSIIAALPYDRINTSMRGFIMCDSCLAEYNNPGDRRFHAQPNACPDCGPHLELWNDAGTIIATRHEALQDAVAMILEGRVVAVKGLGGFHLVVSARHDGAVKLLRERKHREEKPFALMAPSLDWVRYVCRVSDFEARLLISPEAPIVILERIPGGPNDPGVTPAVAPGNPYLGIMLPYTPLHHILLRELQCPIVATSGNLTDEPICTDEREALDRLWGIADAFLVHNRPIVRHVDDSIARIMVGRELIVRRARGFAPLPVELPQAPVESVAVGAHLKNTVAVSKGTNVFVSQHIGDLETAQSYSAFQSALSSLRQLFEVRPARVVSDLHPDYLSTRFARGMGLPVITVQHHFAHVASCIAENRVTEPVLGVSWDGTGYGPDGTVWGGEFLLTHGSTFERIGTFRRFMLPGGDRAVKEPRRSALGVLYEILGPQLFEDSNRLPISAFTAREITILHQALDQKLNAPVTSSAGRLFDAVASIMGLRQVSSYEGQAAMELEFCTAGASSDECYEIRVSPDRVFDWEGLIRGILHDSANSVPRSLISAKFHNSLTEVIVSVARIAGQERVVLTGGCFQNRYLTERTVQRLTAEGFKPYWHQRIPPNDGGIALGQIYASAHTD